MSTWEDREGGGKITLRWILRLQDVRMEHGWVYFMKGSVIIDVKSLVSATIMLIKY
jgi:hypothetical protein